MLLRKVHLTIVNRPRILQTFFIVPHGNNRQSKDPTTRVFHYSHSPPSSSSSSSIIGLPNDLKLETNSILQRNSKSNRIQSNQFNLFILCYHIIILFNANVVAVKNTYLYFISKLVEYNNIIYRSNQ
jgi:hypothetical protein